MAKPALYKSTPAENPQTRDQGTRGRCDNRFRWIAPCARSVILLTLSIQFTSAAESTGKAWIEQSNSYARLLFDVQLRHSPEQGSTEGLARFDGLGYLAKSLRSAISDGRLRARALGSRL
jgi:hypothetical protein